MSQNPLQILQTENDQAIAPLAFTAVDQYTTFRAEFAVTGDDLVFHFYMKGGPADPTYWSNVFPFVLDHVARECFKADYPRLQARRIDDFDIDSWWFRAFGFATGIDPAALAQRFLRDLDAALDKKKAM
jgi:hypothetical protein